MAEELAELRAALEQKQQELQTAGEMGKMLVDKCETISRDAAERAAEFATEKEELASSNEVLAARVKELETENENLESRENEYKRIVEEKEAEIESMSEDRERNEGDASAAATKARAQLEIKCRDLQEQANEYQSELDKAQQQIEALTKSADRAKKDLEEAQERVVESESIREKLEADVKEKDDKLRSMSQGHSETAAEDERHYKEQLDDLERAKDDMMNKVAELQDVNIRLTKQHDEDQTLLDDVKATNVMLREALETKELEWGSTGDNNLASFAPKESLLGEIEQHFNRFASFGSPQKSSKMPNFMDVVKRDFENLAHRIHRLRQKMEKKWPDPPPGAAPAAAAADPAAATTSE